MRALPFSLAYCAPAFCAAALALTPSHGAAQIMMGAGQRTEGTPSDRLARNIPEPVSREADDPRAERRLLYPRGRPGVGVEVGQVSPVDPAPGLSAERAARGAGYAADPVPAQGAGGRARPRAGAQAQSGNYDYN